jgi:hypothetical protein
VVRRRMWAAIAATVLWAPMVAAQDRPQDGGAKIPESAMPPAGMCRVWLRDVPESRQPAPTDCGSAIRSMPRNAVVLFGDLKRAGTVAGERSGATVPARNRAGSRAMPSFRGVPGGQDISSMPVAPQGAYRNGSGVVGVGATAPAAAVKAPEAKAAIKPDKPE